MEFYGPQQNISSKNGGGRHVNFGLPAVVHLQSALPLKNSNASYQNKYVEKV